MPHHEKQRRLPCRGVDLRLLPGALLPALLDREHRGVLPPALDAHHGVVGLIGARREEEAERGEDLGGAEVGGLAEHGADEVGAVVVRQSGDEVRRRVREAAGLREREEDVVLAEARSLGADNGSDGGAAARAPYGGRL